MYVFTRTGRLRPGKTREAMAWAVGITEKVNQITSLDIGLWTPVFSPGLGTLVWSTFVESLTDLEDANAKLMVDDGFVAEVDRGAADFTASEGLDDTVAQVLSGEIDPNRNPTYVAVVQSALANGSFAKGIEAGIEIARMATEIGGIPTAFVVSSTGTYGGVAWLSGALTLEELERSEQAVNANPDFVKYVDEVASPRYLPNNTTQVIYQRLA
jgi:hypothetical protein